MRESIVESYLKSRVEANDGLCLKFKDPSQNGAPDRLVVFHGIPTLYVELKRPIGGVLSVAQGRYHAKLRARGQRVYLLRSPVEVDAFMTEVSTL